MTEFEEDNAGKVIFQLLAFSINLTLLNYANIHPVGYFL